MASKSKKFEDELRDLEEIVNRIDSGDMSLEESITAFERGVALVRSLNLKLDEVERKVEVLMRTAQGELRTEPFDESANAASAPPESGNPSPKRSGSTDQDDDLPF